MKKRQKEKLMTAVVTKIVIAMEHFEYCTTTRAERQMFRRNKWVVHEVVKETFEQLREAN